MSTSASVQERGDDGYAIRPYEPGDAEDVGRLYETVWGSENGEQWLSYKFEENPFLDETATIVAEAHGEVVGVRPAVPVPMQAGFCDLTAVYLASLMVHPDHRRRGLFTQMMTQGLKTYAEAGVSVCFNFGNERSAPGYRKLGFESLGTGPEHHVRVQHPGRFVENRVSGSVGRVAVPVANAAARGYLTARRFGRSDSSRWRVQRQFGVATDLLAGLYDPSSTRTVHTRRDPELYRWLGNNPNWEYVTYRATDGGDARAAVLVKRRAGSGADDPCIVDAVPRVSASTRPAFERLLEAVVTDHRDAAALSVKGLFQHERLFPGDILTAFGFRSTFDEPLSRTNDADDYTVFVRPLDGAGERIAAETGIDLCNASDWRIQIR